jgi:hypothetical protein
MSRLDAAFARFSAALTRVEASAAARTNGGAARDNEVLRLSLERERLLGRIAALEEETNSLAGLTEAVEARLDGAIAEIRTALTRTG